MKHLPKTFKILSENKDHCNAIKIRLCNLGYKHEASFYNKDDGIFIIKYNGWFVYETRPSKVNVNECYTLNDLYLYCKKPNIPDKFKIILPLNIHPYVIMEFLKTKGCNVGYSHFPLNVYGLIIEEKQLMYHTFDNQQSFNNNKYPLITWEELQSYE